LQEKELAVKIVNLFSSPHEWSQNFFILELFEVTMAMNFKG